MDDFFFDCTKTGWNFRGWSYDNQRIFDEKGHQLVNPVMAKNMVFKAMFAQTARLTIEKNIPEAGIVTGEGEYAYNTDVDISAKANDGYIFVGWYVQNILVSASEEYKYRMWSEDVVIEARFSMTVNKLHIESNNPTMGQVRINNNDGGSYGAEDNGYFSRGTSVTIVTYTIGETRFLGWFDEDNELVDTGAIYTFIMPDEEYNLEAKWNNFNITYKLEGGINDEDNPDHYTVESGVFALKPAHKDGYRFDGWKLGDDIITSVDSNWLRHIELTAVWGIDEYTITYHLNGGTNNPNNPTTFTAFDDTITLLSPSKTGYTFSGWYSDPGFEERVYDIPSGTSSDVELYAKWKVISYTITYLLNGGTNNSGNPSTYTIEDEITLLNPSKIGYVFSNWTNNSGETVTKIQPGTTGNLTLTANWNLAKYNVTTNVYPAGAGTASIVSGEGYYDETITVTATAFDNNIFRGWMINNTIVSRDYTYSFKMPNSNVSLVARFYDSDQIEHIERGSLPHLVNSKTITYGMYPKTRVTNSSLIAALESTSISGNYYVYNGNYYSLRIKGEEHLWFKCELIEWTVLEKYGTSQDGADLYKVISKDIIDARPYNDSYKAHSVDGITYYANDYEYSSIRSYLNDDFLTGGLYGGSYAYSIDRTYSRGTYYTLKDKVCILTDTEMNSFFPTAESRICSFTDYASSFNPETIINTLCN